MKKKRKTKVNARKMAGQSVIQSTRSAKVSPIVRMLTLTKYPLPALALGDEATNHGCEIITTSQSKGVYAHVRASLMREVDIRD
jgi:hypothetical protein